MCSHGSRYRFVLTVLGALSAMAALGHAQESLQLSGTTDREVSADESSLLSAEGALDDAGGIAGGSTECESIGDWILIPPLSGTSRLRGNAYTVASDANLVEIGMELQIPNGTSANIEFAVYFRDVDNAWVQQFSVIRTFLGTGTRGMMRSGTIDPPLQLVGGVQYAIVTGWGAQNISYNQDLADYPQPFAIGTIDGRVGRNSVTAPLPLSFNQAVSDNAYSMELCLTGACCLPSGVCDNLTRADCLGSSGQFAATGTSCTSVGACPLEGGACCLDDNTCAFINQFACNSLGGSWNETVACNDPTEPCAPRGGCCLPGGGCLNNVTRTVCAASSGTYRGDGVSCGTFPPCTAGACCFGTSCVLEITEFDCALAGGTFGGAGSSCAGNPCVKDGACCLDTTCSEMVQSDCATAGGLYRGDGTDCATVTPVCGRGACCVPGTGCQDANGAGVTQSFCTGVLSGTFTNGASCETIEPRCPGTCCAFSTEVCIDDVVPIECVTKAIGFFIGYETVCDSEVDVCAAPTRAGTCCVGDGRCVEVDSESTCVDDLRGSFDPTVTTCAPDSCVIVPTGACCDRIALTCSDGVIEGACNGEWNEDTACSELSPVCEDRGACCDADGVTCTNSTIQAPCETAGGTWSAVKLCNELDPPCAPRGACCEDNGAQCSLTSQFLCESVGGVYRGDSTTCEDALVCNLGACCQRDGTCEDDVLDTECVGPIGAPPAVFFAGRPCEDVCVARGACCVGGDCRITTELECDNAGGIYSGVGTDCVADLCVVGACCTQEVGTACQQRTRQTCEMGFGVYLGPGGDCSGPDACVRGACCSALGAGNNGCVDDTVQLACDNPSDFREGDICTTCFGRGACCLPMGVCLVQERLECLEQGGEYSGDGTLCDPTDLCRNGACCFQDATCTVDTRQGCEPAGGTYVGAETSCDPGICIGIGGCCVEDFCVPDLTATVCNDISGLFLGVGSDCSDASACTDTGACCDESTGNCINGVLEAACRSGTWSVGALCTQVACDTPGACCDPINRTCTDGVTQSNCAGTRTSWSPIVTCDQLEVPCQFDPTGSCCNHTTFVCNDGIVAVHCAGAAETWSEGVRCRDLDPACVAPEMGACCDNGSCSIRRPTECAAIDGLYLGADSVCDDTCTLGACCRVNGTCIGDVRADECTEVDATFTMGETCGTVTCVAMGSCCEPDCVDLTEGDCDLAGGTFIPNNPPGTCCFAPTCADRTPAECAANLGTYGGDGSACVEATCAPGACCSGDSGCIDEPDLQLSRQECESGFGTFLGIGADCKAGSCPTGACCTGNSGCTDTVSEAFCEANGDVFQGVGSTCDSGVCDSGCCCEVDGTFANSTLRTDCEAPDQRFEAGLCSNLNPPCAVRGACCLPDEVIACRLLTREDCEQFVGSTYAGDATTCGAGNLCEVGACCTDEVCGETTRFGCGAGSFRGAGSTCTPDDQCQIGGCCLENEVCHDVPLFECDDDAGVFLGAGAFCERDSCDLCDPTILSSDPTSCLIDARYPHEPADPGVRLGMDSIVLTLSCEPNSITAGDFAVTVSPNDVPVPGISSAVLDVTTVTITFDAPIADGRWTCITHVASDTSACLGSLPADVNSDRTASPSDILDLIDDLNGVLVPPLGVHQCDIDRSGQCGPADILGVIDLLNGSAQFQVWNAATLPICPAAP